MTDSSTLPDLSRLGVVVVGYGPPDVLRRNVARHDLGGAGVRVVLVDNYSGEEARARSAELCAELGWHFLPMPDNRGFGAGANAGAHEAVRLGCTGLVFLNPDAALDVATAAALLAQVEAEPSTMVSPHVVRPDGRDWFVGAELSLTTGWTRRTGKLRSRDRRPWLSGACLAVSARWWQTLDGFDEDFFLYWEDVDVSYRTLQAGGRLLMRADLRVEHEVGGTQTGTGQAAGGRGPRRSRTYQFYNCRNRMLFARRNLGPGHRLRWLLIAPAYAGEVVLRDGARSLLRDPGPLRAVAAGTWAGLRAPRRGVGVPRAARAKANAAITSE